MKKSTVELIVGGSILVAAFILVTGVLWLKEATISSKMVQYTVLFPQIGSLQVGDPVMVCGVKMGNVKSLNLGESGVRVAINLDKSVPLTDSADVTVQNIGLMGERVVGILLNNAGSLVKPNNANTGEETPVQGHFDSGIAEAMGAIGDVLADVEVMIRNVQGIIDHTVGDTAFVTFFQTTVSRLDTVVALVEELVTENKDGLDTSLKDVRAVTANLRKLVDSNQDNINTIMNNGSALTDRAITIAGEIEDVTTSVKSILSSIEEGEGTVGRLMQDESFYDDLKVTVDKLDTLVTDIQDNGLKLRIKLGFKRSRR